MSRSDIRATPARKSFEVTMRSRLKRYGIFGSHEFRQEAQILDPAKHDMIDAITIDFDLPLGVIALTWLTSRS